MANPYRWSKETGTANGDIDNDINWQENQPPSSVNDSSRNQLASHARFYEAVLGGLTTTGAGASYALTTELTNPGVELRNGLVFAFKAHVDSLADATFNVDGTGAKKLYRADLQPVKQGDLLQDRHYSVKYEDSLDSANGGWVLSGGGSELAASWKNPVRFATTENIVLAGLQTIDGIAAVEGDRALVKDQTAKPGNGLYVASAGAWVRTSDASDWDQLVSAVVVVEEGTTNANTSWQITSNRGGILGTTDVDIRQFINLSGVDQDILPDTDNTRSLGSNPSTPGKGWKEVWSHAYGDQNGLLVPAQYVTQGSAKAFVNYDLTGTPSLTVSFNVSTLVDNGTGLGQINFTNAMASADIAATGISGQAANTGNRFLGVNGDNGGLTAISASFVTRNESSNSVDTDVNCASIFGDLA